MASDDDDDNEDCFADDGFREDIEALRRACMLAGESSSTHPAPSSPSPAETANSRGGATATNSSFDSDSDAGDSGNDDVEFVRSLHQRFASGLSNGEEPLTIKPLCPILPIGEDDNYENDFETLRAIQRRFAAYEDYDSKKESRENSLHISEQVGVTNIAWEKESSNNLFVESSNAWEGFPNCVDNSCGTSQSVEALNENISQAQHTNLIEWHETGGADEAIIPLKEGSFPRSAQAFVDAIKKNRSCQKLLRSKLTHIEARMEEMKKLKDLVKILKDFQISCRKRTSLALSRKKDVRVQLISRPKIRANAKLNGKKPSAMYYGPPENSQVANYQEALKQFPVFLGREKWTNEEKENLAKGVKQQFQEMLLQRSLHLVSGPDGSLRDSNDLDSLFASIGDHDITPESLRSFIPLVNWDQLASMYVPRRSGAECQSRWLNSDDPLLNQNSWSKMEDKNLLHVVQQKGVSNWVDISSSLATNRTPFQCLARYQRSLNASILKREWTEEEDNLLRAAVEAFGERNWQAVASTMEGRTGPQCSNRWKKTLNPARVKVGRWAPDEDKRLKVAVMLFGPKTWNKIAEFVPGRTQVQCRERWVNSLDPSLNWKSWTEEEDLKLNAAISEHGYCWSKVAACVPHRTDNQCWRRWKALAPQEVPLLQAVRKLQKDALISNFVDRESERSTLGPGDFIPLPAIADASEQKNANPSVKQKKRSRRRGKAAVTETGRSETLEEMANSEDRETCDSVVLNGGVDLSLKKRTRSKPYRRKPKSGGKTSACDVLSKKGRELRSCLKEHQSSYLMDPNSSVITNAEDVGELGKDNGGSCHRKSSKLHPRRKKKVVEEDGGSDASYKDVSELNKDATQASEPHKDVTGTCSSKQVKTIVVHKSNASKESHDGAGDVRDVQSSLITGKKPRKRKRATKVGEDVCKFTSPSNEDIENADFGEPVQISSSPVGCSVPDDVLESEKSEALAIQSNDDDSHKNSKKRRLLDKVSEEKEEDYGMTLASFLNKLQGENTLASPMEIDKNGVEHAEASYNSSSTTANLGCDDGLHSSGIRGETPSIQKYAEEDGVSVGMT